MTNQTPAQTAARSALSPAGFGDAELDRGIALAAELGVEHDADEIAAIAGGLALYGEAAVRDGIRMPVQQGSTAAA